MCTDNTRHCCIDRARRVETRALFWTVAVILSGCGSGGSGEGASAAQEASNTAAVSTSVTRNAPPIPSGPFMVQGNVYTATGGAVSASPVNLWVQTAGIGFSYWFAYGRTYADAAGHYVASNLPSSESSLFAAGDGYRQPCAVIFNPETTQLADAELVTVESLNAFNPLHPQSGSAPALTGFAYEVTAAGRVPVTGAELWAEKYMDTGIATTRTDLSGRFYLCHLPKNVYVYVGKSGFKERWLGPLDGSASQDIEVELTRL